MPDAFDPYHRWLGIPPKDQPPNHYRLLGIELFESLPDVIAAAADQRMAHLRTFQAGKHSRDSQRLLNEVACARLCLLSAEKKAAYDKHLSEQLGGGATGPATSDMLGEYRLLEKLGEGGMGAVFKALHTKLDRVVALKILRKEFLSDSQAVARFEREMKAAGAVDDPLVVRALDAREVGGVRLLAMEFVEGFDLATLVTRCSPLSVADACELIRQGALGLECVHQHKLVHRDIKPSNLMLNRQGQVKLLDLGLAKFEAARAGQEVTAADHAVGTLEYMAPERISGEEHLDIRSDIYALGCALFKLLAGRTPFAGSKSTASLLNAHLQQPPPRMDKIRRDIPKELAHIVERMLAKSPEKRYAAPVDVARALAPFCATSDLRRLLARAEGRTHGTSDQGLPSETPRAIVGAETSFTGFLRQAASQLRRPRHQTTTGEPRQLPRALIFGGIALAAAVLLIAALLGIRAMWRATPPQPTIAFQWPLEEREGAELLVDGKQVAMPSEATWQEVCEAGKHKIRFTRQGYVAYEAALTLAPGQAKEIKPVWQAETCLVLRWAEGERQGAIVEIDGEAVDLSKAQAGKSADETRWLLVPGTHKLRIAREGFAPFEQTFQIAGGKMITVEPEWHRKPLPAEVAVKPVEPAVPETKPEVPAKIEKPAQSAEEVARQQAAAKEAERQLKARQELTRKAREEEQREQAFNDGMRAVEEHAAAWDFASAQKALADVHFEDATLAARATARDKELQRLATLKSRIVSKIKGADPPLTKAALGLRGFPGTITTVNDEWIEATLSNGKTERHAWSKLGTKTVPKLLKIVVRPDSPDDWVAAGLLAIVCQDTAMAGRCLEEAGSLGADVGPYLSPLAALSFGQARQLLAKSDFRKAAAALDSIEQKYATVVWFSSHKASFDAARSELNNGIHEKEAEDLYVSAVRALNEQQLFEVRTLVEKLKMQYAGTRPSVETGRKPCLAELEAAVKDLGKLLVVCQVSGSGFKKIQQAIDAATPNSTIEIQDSGSYNEQILIPAEKPGLTLRGKKGCWPIITSDGPVRDFRFLILIEGKGAVLDGLVLLHRRADVREFAYCVHPHAPAAHLRRCVVAGGKKDCVSIWGHLSPVVDTCFVLPGWSESPTVRDSFVINLGQGGGDLNNVVLCGELWPGEQTTMKSCTLVPGLLLSAGMTITDSISGPIDARGHNLCIENSCVHGEMPLYHGGAKAGKGCLSADPMFVNPDKFDYRLKAESPCRGKASDGGDLGAHYTPEMIEMLRIAFALRAKRLIDF
jgi:serine/threonine protein kinase